MRTLASVKEENNRIQYQLKVKTSQLNIEKNDAFTNLKRLDTFSTYIIYKHTHFTHRIFKYETIRKCKV